MKQSLLVILFIMIIKPTGAQLSLGSRTGINIETGNNPGLSLKNNRIAASGGFYIKYCFKKKLTLQTELIYNTSAASPELVKSTSATQKIKAGQLRLPITLQYRLKNVFAETGIQLRSPVNMLEKANGKKSLVTEDLYKAASIGIVFGSGYTFKNKLAGLRLNIRYNIDYRLNPSANGNNIRKNLNIAFTYRLFAKKIALIKPYKPGKK